jgi:type VI secretion system secreted protein VgrG
MPSPKSGKAGAAVEPTQPGAAQDADRADPGEVEKAKTQPRQTQSGMYRAAKTKPHTSQQRKKRWIEIELAGEEGGSIASQAYQIHLRQGTLAGGCLDEKGLARIAGIEAGNCKVTLSKLDHAAGVRA